MNYIDLIRNFWRCHEEHSFSVTEIALYFHLIEVCNLCSWKNPFKRNNSLIMAHLGIKDRRTLDNARNKLVQARLIKCDKKATNPNVTYGLTCALNAQADVQVSVQADVQADVQVDAQADDTKDKLNKTKLKRRVDKSTCPTSQSDVVKVDYSQLVIWVNEKIKGVYGQIREPISDKRKKSISCRIRDHGKETFCEAITKAVESDFLRNSTFCNFDWIIKPTNFEKIISGNYDNKDKRDNQCGSTINEELFRGVAEGIARGYQGLAEQEKRDKRI